MLQQQSLALFPQPVGGVLAGGEEEPDAPFTLTEGGSTAASTNAQLFLLVYVKNLPRIHLNLR